jgi:CxxC motif-containing protein
MEVKELTCIGCPLGCALTVKTEGGSVVSVSGNTCKRGDDYARKEMTDPRRIVTSTVRVKGGSLPVVSVKTKGDIPKNLIKKCLEELKDVELRAPVSIGDVVLSDAAGTGIPVVATKNLIECEKM